MSAFHPKRTFRLGDQIPACFECELAVAFTVGEQAPIVAKASWMLRHPIHACGRS